VTSCFFDHVIEETGTAEESTSGCGRLTNRADPVARWHRHNSSKGGRTRQNPMRRCHGHARGLIRTHPSNGTSCGSCQAVGQTRAMLLDPRQRCLSSFDVETPRRGLAVNVSTTKVAIATNATKPP
jgi:hypothetical protein